MTFQNIRFPTDISYGATGGPKFNTTVLTLSSGHEKRNINWSSVRCEYDVAYGIKTQSQMDDVRDFFYARRGRAYGFRFRDWSDYELVRQSIGSTDTTTQTFQIYKRYTNNSVTYDRDLAKIVSDGDVVTYGLSVWVNNTAITEGGGAGNFSINRNTGIITFGSSLYTTSGHNIEVQCEFDVPVRFDTDHLNVSIDNFSSQSWNQIPIVEIRDIS